VRFHGWTAQDRADTEEALADPNPVRDTSTGREAKYVYKHTYTGSDGQTACQRIVVVDFRRDDDSTFIYPKDIITSYAEAV
jgi:hypothetical protein